jgi:Protein of unknown function (DUF1569)
MHPTLEQIRMRLLSATEGMTPSQWSQHQDGKWCAAEVVEHLSLTYGRTAQGMQRVLAAGKPNATPLTFKQRLGILMVVEVGHFPEGREAPRQVRPSGTQDGARVLSETLENLAKMDTAIAACEERFGSSTHLVDHPILGALNARQWRKFHAVHARHHAPQIERLRSQS